MGRNSIVFLLVFFISGTLLAQENIYLVLLKDKNNTPYSIDQPEQFLSPRSIARKVKYSIPVTEEDLPVDPAYLETLKNNHNISILHSSKWFNAVIVTADMNESLQLLGEPFVQSVEQIAIGTDIPSGEKGAGSNYTGLSNKIQNRIIGIPEMHQKGFTGEGMLIAIFDSGFAHVDQSSFYQHVFDNNRIIFSRDFIGKSDNVFQYDIHGSRSFSTFAAYKEDVYKGSAYNADFVLCVTENVVSEYRVEEYYWLAAAELADSLGVDVISSSLAYTEFDHPGMNYTYEDLDGKTAIITQAAKLAASKGMVVVTSAGNDGNKRWKYINTPGDADSILTIGSVNLDLQRSAFSSYGPTADGRIKPDLCALGNDAVAVTGENIAKVDGTSFSAPQISGLVAGFWQAFPDLTGQEVIEILKATASNSASPDTLIGYGIPNFMEAFNKASDVEENTEETFVVYPNPVDGTKKVFVDSNGFLEIGKVNINFIDFKGAFIKSMEMQVFSRNEILEIDVSDLHQGYYLAEFNANNKSKIVKLVVL